jgi:hypothetical protein
MNLTAVGPIKLFRITPIADETVEVYGVGKFGENAGIRDQITDYSHAHQLPLSNRGRFDISCLVPMRQVYPRCVAITMSFS